jgi:hypothetical protein
MNKLFANNLRAAATWIGSPIVVILIWLVWECFFSTDGGAFVGVIVGPPGLFGLALLIGAFFYVFRK